MKTYKLRGVAEGLVGKSSVRAKSAQDVIKTYPQLNMAKDKLIVIKQTIKGFTACDG